MASINGSRIALGSVCLSHYKTRSIRKGEWSAITQVKVFSPEICLIALGQRFHHLEASSAARDSGECVSDVPGSEAMAGQCPLRAHAHSKGPAVKRRGMSRLMPYTEMDNITPTKLTLISEWARKDPKFY